MGDAGRVAASCGHGQMGNAMSVPDPAYRRLKPSPAPDRPVPSGDGGWDAIARTLTAIGRLKHTLRTGWLDRGVPPPETESVADHSYRVALLAWMVASTYPTVSADGESLDAARVLLIALAHDLPEAFAGDPTPYAPDDIPPQSDPVARRAFLQRRQEREPDRSAQKRLAEQAAMVRLLDGLPARLAKQLGDAWQEYEEQATPEARIVKQADKLETFLQSREYLADDTDLPMESFAQQIADPRTLPDREFRHLRDAIERIPAGD